MTRRLLGVAYRTYPEWWRDRYEEEAREVADQLVADGRSSLWMVLDVAGDGLRHRLRPAPQALRPPARAVVLRASGRSLSSMVVCYVLLVAALLAAAAADPEYVQAFMHPTRSMTSEHGLDFVLFGRVALAIGAGLALLAVLTSFFMTLVRVFRARDRRGAVLLGAVAAPVALVPAIAYAAVSIGRGWAAGGTSNGYFSVPQVFAMILMNQHFPAAPVVPLDGAARLSVGDPVGLGILCAASWVALAAVGALAMWGARGLRRRPGLPVTPLRVDALLAFGGGVATAAAWACLLGWGLSVPPVSFDVIVCPGGPFCAGGGPPVVGITALWWAVVVVTGIACARSLVAGSRALGAVRQLRRLAKA